MRRSDRALFTLVFLSYILCRPNRINIDPDNWVEAENDAHSVPAARLEQEEDIVYRAPYFLILGTQKGGTRAMATFLLQHPQIKYHNEIELNFFTTKFRPFKNKTASNLAKKEIVDVDKARQAHAQFYNRNNRLQRNKTLVTFDSTPVYLFKSNKVAPRVKLVNPWAKLIILLRNPVDRAYSDYNMELNSKKNFKYTFEAYVQQDLKRLQQAGLVNAWNGTNWDKTVFDGFRGSIEEDTAWNEYIKTGKLGFNPLGRGLYAIQLRQWFSNYNISYTDDRQNQFLVLRQEDVKGMNGTVNSFNQIVQFLGLPQSELRSVKERHVGNYTQGRMSLQTRMVLEEFFNPYNEQLPGLLGQEWANVWDDQRNQQQRH